MANVEITELIAVLEKNQIRAASGYPCIFDSGYRVSRIRITG